MKHKKENDATSSDLLTQNNAGPVVHEFWGGADIVIYSYTRAQAIADGVLIDASALAREAGFRYPVALTQAAWHDCVAVSTTDKTHDDAGRLWDVLNMLRFAIKFAGPASDRIFFSVDICDEHGIRRTVRLKSICGAGDSAEPVITIMLPDED